MGKLFEKIALQAFDDEMENIMKSSGISHIVDRKVMSQNPKSKEYLLTSGTNSGVPYDYGVNS
jgi:hypothetical protein